MADDYVTGTDESGGRYMLVHVPAWDGESDDEDVYPGCYIQLGSYPKWGDDKQRGDDLLTLAGVGAATSFFADDYRSALGKTASSTTYSRNSGYATATATAASLTAELKTRGGIRIHSDGNYVSTTRGDRVDVIGGNYQLAVFGRTDGSYDADVWRPAKLESSGGHMVRDDVLRRGRQTMIEWDSTRSTYRTYFNTLKGYRTVRFEGPYEEVFECDTIKDSVGCLTGSSSTTIPTVAAEPHQQSDASSWINPSAGAGSAGWPRKETAPTDTHKIDAGKIDESVKVVASLGTTKSSNALDRGTINKERHVDGWHNHHFNCGGGVEDWIEADSGATVTEEYGFSGELLASQPGETHRIYFSQYQFSLGQWKRYHYNTRDLKRSCGANDFRSLLDAYVVDIDVGVGVRSRVTDLVNCVHPAWVKESYWSGDDWDDNWFNALMTTFFWGQSEFTYKPAVPTMEMFFGLTRFTTAIVYNKMMANFDHVEINGGSADKLKMFKIMCEIMKTSCDVADDEGGVVQLSANTMKVKS